MAKEVMVNKEECTACNLCIETTPSVFRADSEGLAEVYDVNGASEEEIQEAIDSCPAQCIHWKE